ncbi:Predicted trehalose synthase [Nonomuraea pusilla]|uniref:Glucosamine kinase n=1 Tax=Nonomuraea pusilla TaxID=46177 RepID=A0A1H7W4W0_9ACTN|nr:Predicted trehalose synthase [Nonomuraea pusilla]
MNWDSITSRLLSLGEKPLTARDRGITAALLPLLAGDVPHPLAVRRFRALPTLSYDPGSPHTGVPAERDFGPHVDQTNYSVVVAEQVVVKWLTPPVPLPHPAPELLAHLVEAGFNDTAPPYAALTLFDKGRELLVALVTGYLPEARDGWEWCVDDAEADETAFAADLGRLTADLHLALSTYPAPTPASAGHSPGPSPAPSPTSSSGPSSASFPEGGEAGSQGGGLLARAEEALREALELTDGDDGRWLAAHAETLRAGLAPLATPARGTVTSAATGTAAGAATGTAAGALIRIHGDLHVGQILRWRDGYAVIDFDGNPTVAGAQPYQPAARDVAQLATSLEHVAQVAILRRGVPAGRATAWAARARALLLDAYRGRLAARGRPDLLDESLLRPFEIEQECRELIYAARHLPRWRYAPMGVLRTWYPEETP